MTFQEAHKKLQEITNGEYNQIGYEVRSKNGKILDVQCSVYMHNYTFYTADTWEEALNLLEKAIQQRTNPQPVTLEEAPE